ncbi:acyltransferase [Pseudonocardiaceae bacterium YIM PH 21723]|nr:acyltransferase [Pseudonocardiaceae bacterium YIM PH 21723]
MVIGDQSLRRLPGLTGLRFPLAFAVFLAHATAFVGPYRGNGPGGILRFMWPLGYGGVSVFFVLSGFVLTWSARERDTPAAFWRRRIVKIFPVHLVTTMLAGVLAVAVGIGPFLALTHTPTPIRLDGLISGLFLAQNWIPGRAWQYGLNSVSWSISCELFFYLAFPLLYRLIGRWSARRLWSGCGIMVAASLVPPVLANGIGGEQFGSSPDTSVLGMWVTYVFPPSRLPEFLLGMLLARVCQTNVPPVRLWHAVLALLAIMGSLQLLSSPFASSPIYAAGAGLLVLAVARRDLLALPSGFRSRFMVYWGTRSYSLYLVHLLVIMAATVALFGRHRAVDDLTATATVFGIFLPLSAIAACLLYRYVEQPMVQRFSSPQRAAASTGPSTAGLLPGSGRPDGSTAK